MTSKRQEELDEVRRDFENDAPGLWSVLGELEEVEVGDAFVATTVAETGPARSRPLWRAAAAAVVLLLLGGWWWGQSGAAPEVSTPEAPASDEPLTDVFDALSAFSVEDDLALEVDEIQAVQDEWFGAGG